MLITAFTQEIFHKTALATGGAIPKCVIGLEIVSLSTSGSPVVLQVLAYLALVLLQNI